MRIVIIQDRLRSGGTERQSLLLAKAFSHAGHTTSLIIFRPGGQLAGSAEGVRTLVLQPIDFHLDWFAPKLVSTLAAEKPEIILCMGRMANCYAGHLQQAFPAAVVIATMRTGKKLPMLYRRSLQKARHVVANSHEARRVLGSEYSVSLEKISVIHNSLVFSDTSGSQTDDISAMTILRARLGAEPETRVLLCVAMLRPEKNQRELIQIVGRLPAALDWQLWLAGDGPGRRACEAAARQSPAPERIKFLGFCADPSALYRAADLAVLTSRSESLPNFLIEAHAHGLPSVAYQVGGIAECGGITVQPDDQSGFASALDRLLRDDAARKTESARVSAYARTHFAPDAQVASYLDLFSRLLNAPPS
jgi:glycosyltransferase involved in cell wall biosynthesis